MNLTEFTFSPNNKIYYLTDQEIEKVKLLSNKKNIIKLLVLDGKIQYYDDLINISLEYDNFFNNLRDKYNIPDNFNMSINFLNKQLTIIEDKK